MTLSLLCVQDLLALSSCSPAGSMTSALTSHPSAPLGFTLPLLPHTDICLCGCVTLKTRSAVPSSHVTLQSKAGLHDKNLSLERHKAFYCFFSTYRVILPKKKTGGWVRWRCPLRTTYYNIQPHSTRVNATQWFVLHLSLVPGTLPTTALPT